MPRAEGLPPGHLGPSRMGSAALSGVGVCYDDDSLRRERGQVGMCQSRVVAWREGHEHVLMEDVVTVRPEDEHLYLEDLYGQQKRIRARIKELQLMDHRIVVEEE